jgi:adenylylsulfate kinase
MQHKILIMGLPGSGKTVLAKQLVSILNADHYNADEVRATLNLDLGFSLEDRYENARRLGVVCDFSNKFGRHAIADFVCPTEGTRECFSRANKATFTIFMNTIEKGRFEDTNLMFVKPTNNELTLTDWEYSVPSIIRLIKGI